MSNASDSLYLNWMKLFAALMFVMAVYGGYVNYSIIPFWDMWNGMYGFLTEIENKNYAIWWAQHNEHRIVLARLLFWIDHTFAGTRGIFLVVMSYISILCASLLFYLFSIRIELAEKIGKSTTLAIVFFVFGCLFSWVQSENFTWGFQAQFFLAQLLALGMFYFLASANSKGEGPPFFLGCFLGVWSALTLANGVIALPLALVMSFFLRMRASQKIVLFVLSLSVPMVYFLNYHSPSGGASISNVLFSNFTGVVEYILVYLGNPFYEVFKEFPYALQLTKILGVVFIVIACASVVLILRRGSPYEIALLFFILFVGGTALLTAGGRASSGAGQALSSRYTTPVIMGWAASIILLFAITKYRNRTPLFLYKSVMVVLSVTILIFQFKVFDVDYAERANRRVAALAASLEIRDELYLRKIFPSVDYLRHVTEQTRFSGWGVFTQYPYRGNRELLGEKLSINSEVKCQGSLLSVENVEGSDNFVRLKGWFYDEKSKSVPDKMTILNKSGEIVGFLLGGGESEFARTIIGNEAKTAGFVGYAFSSLNGADAVLLSSGGGCAISVHVPKIMIQLRSDMALLRKSS